MPKIALVEPYDHSEVLYVLCGLLMGRQHIELHIFTQDYIEANAPEKARFGADIRWFAFTNKERPAFFQRQKERLNECDLIIWITALAPLGWINRLRLKPPVVLVIHNRHTWFAPFDHIDLPLSSHLGLFISLGRFARLILFQHAERKKMLEWVSAVAFPSRNILRLALQDGHLPASTRAFYMPLGCFEGVQPNALTVERDDMIRIVIPGTITNNGRDYGLLADALEEAVPRFKKPVELALLGGVKHGKEVVKKIQNLQRAGFRLITFGQWIPQQEYEAYMRGADFLILPFKAFRRFGIIKESLGISAVSGSISDMIRFGIPAICSHHYHLDTEVEKLVMRYEDQAELADLLSDWVNQKTYLRVKKEAFPVLSTLACEICAEELRTELSMLSTK